MNNKEPAEIRYSEPRYMIECLGDIEDKQTFATLDLALHYLKDTYGYPDPEDDRMLIWEILPSGHMKVIWHFSGWHWNGEEFGVPPLRQGSYIGEDKSVYEISSTDPTDSDW